MRLGARWRRALALIGLLSFAAGTASAGLFRKTIPREVAAIDLSTGQPYSAPPIPYGHYAKDKVGYIHERVGMVTGAVGGLFHRGNACNSCGGRGCAFCSGTGMAPGASMPCSECDGATVGGRHSGGMHGNHNTTGYATVIEGSPYGTPQSAVCQSCGGGGCGLCKGNGRARAAACSITATPTDTATRSATAAAVEVADSAAAVVEVRSRRLTACWDRSRGNCSASSRTPVKFNISSDPADPCRSPQVTSLTLT